MAGVNQPMSIPAPREKAARPLRRVASLLGFLLKAEVDAIFQQQGFETLAGADPLELWREYDNKRRSLGPLQQQPVKALPNSMTSLVEEVKRRKTYQKHYEAAAEYSFALVPIESLLTPQWFADLDYIEELKTRLKPDMNCEELLRFVVAEGRIAEPIVVGSQVTFTSPRRDLYADPIPTVKESEGGEFEIIVRAASRPNYVHVVEIGQRLFLSNGVHKVCALYQMGFREIPALCRKAHNLAEARMDPQSTSLFRPQVFESARPALVTDLMNPDTAVTLKMRSTYQILQVSVGIWTLGIPAPPA
jgi:hypothetical protein